MLFWLLLLGVVRWVVMLVCCHGLVVGGFGVIGEVSACWWRGACIGGGRGHVGLRLPFGLGVPWGRARLVGELLGLAAAGQRSGLAGWGRGG